ncbi:alpha,alpha-trehalase [Candidatus Saccharibacteria bacterium]|nr:alpha,alpha-trehalase [Candidatus Saccharibacteria bacterium]
MIGKVRNLGNKALNIKLLRKNRYLNHSDVKEARKYIEEYWENLIRYHPKDDESLLGLPKPYIVPAHEKGHEFDFNEMYYWDSYFMVQGKFGRNNKELVMGILEDLVYMLDRYGIIPNASRTYLTGRSQPPFLTSFIWEVYETYDLNQKWLKKMMTAAEDEYHTVWMGKVKPNARQVYQGLSRYYDINYVHDLAETESGWDMNTRFNRKALQYLPVDLNALLYKYEIDFEKYYKLIGNDRVAAGWKSASEHRKKVMNELMWSNLKGLYYDYNFVKEKRGVVSSLATFYPMWAGMVDEEQAEQLVKSLKRFENKGGLATTDTQPLNQLVPGLMPTQWAYPNGWAPLHFITIQGLERYGYYDDAERIAMRWLKTNLDWFNKHGVFLEKYNVVNPEKPPVKGVYPSQTGFGWTNAIFERLCQDYIDERI